MIVNILLENTNFDHFKIQDSQDNTSKLQNLNKINVFIGPNNVGKSRFLRAIFGLNELDGEYCDIAQLAETFSTYERLTANFNKSHSELEPWPVISRGRFLTHSNRKAFGIYLNSTPISNKIRHTNDWRLVSDDLFVKLDSMDTDLKNRAFSFIYIPILRGLRPIKHDVNLIFSSDNLYESRTAIDYFREFVADKYENESMKRSNISKGKEVILPKNKKIYTGLDIYNDIDKNRNGVKVKRELVEKFEQKLSYYFFNNKKVELIPLRESDVLSIHVEGDGNERLIHELGDGIQALISLLYPLYINANNENTLVFIEEPELNLHPGMQRIFMEILKSDDFKNLQFFLTTHSNHFLDMSFGPESEISVFRFKKVAESNFEIRNLSSPCDNLMSDLGIRNSSVFLSNCTIWIEGVTDRMYLKKFMNVYVQKHRKFQKYREDLHYSFVEYAGSNITHWDFSEESDKEKIKAIALNRNIFLIVDSDCNEKGIKEVAKENRHNEFKTILGEDFYITSGKEFENILSINTINNVLRQYGETESIEASNEDYKYQNLGKFVDEKLGGQKKRRGSYRDENTISKKVDFCEKSIASIKSIEDLSNDAVELCRIIFEFIETKNR